MLPQSASTVRLKFATQRQIKIDLPLSCGGIYVITTYARIVAAGLRIGTTESEEPGLIADGGFGFGSAGKSFSCLGVGFLILSDSSCGHWCRRWLSAGLSHRLILPNAGCPDDGVQHG